MFYSLIETDMDSENQIVFFEFSEFKKFFLTFLIDMILI